MQVHLSLKSSNAKTGPIPVSTTSKASCPHACSLKGSGCYAEASFLGMHWKKVTEGKLGTSWASFCADIEELPEGQLWRHNQAGDLPSDDQENIDWIKLAMLVDANLGKRGFTYTHYDPAIGHNASLIKQANEMGFTINLSAESLHQADQLADLNIAPVVTLLPEQSAKVTFTPKGRKVITCPATYKDDVSCATCQLCQHQDRPIVGFPVHGTSKAKAHKVFMLKSV